MTKKDGDRLRAMKSELIERVLDYGSDSTTGAALSEAALAIDYALRAIRFEVRPTDPKTGAIRARHDVPNYEVAIGERSVARRI